ncbi:hypothetical protein B0O99DRAFT_617334 [Bisporella sp. PMI_857]|nr:hypothetical protein B0O99DRAFT_617334 [Bisporella sp. PMI_857]
MAPVATKEESQNSKAVYDQRKENTIRVYKHRARYDYKIVYSILESTFFSDVSFVTIDEDGEPSPFMVPMTACAGQYDPSNPLPEDDGDEEQYRREQELFNEKPFDVYLHGNSAMLLNKMTKANGSIKVVISSTKVSGIVLHFAPNGHSLNYRSCIIHGDAYLVTSPQEKLYALHRITNHMVRRRWSSTNPVAPEAMRSVQIIKVVIRTASEKSRATNINGLEKGGLGERQDVWTGVVPLYEVLGRPVESGFTPGRVVQAGIRGWINGRNEEEKRYAETVAQVPVEEAAKIKGVISLGVFK